MRADVQLKFETRNAYGSATDYYTRYLPGLDQSANGFHGYVQLLTDLFECQELCLYRLRRLLSVELVIFA